MLDRLLLPIPVRSTF